METDIIYQNQEIIVLNKPAGIDMTKLFDKLTRDYPQLKRVEREGMAHRLDKDTSGVLVAARTQKSYDWLTQQFSERKVIKKYLALVEGKIEDRGELTAQIARDPKRKTPMKIIPVFGEGRGDPRLTASAWKKIKEINIPINKQNYIASFLEVKIKTGRTHQIRAVMKYLKHPIIGDKVYGNKTSNLIANAIGLKRQFLHSHTLCFYNFANAKVCYRAKLTKDLTNIENIL